MNLDKSNIGLLDSLKIPVDNSRIKVDINVLKSRVKEEERRENKVNYIFFGIALSFILTVGIILSL